MQRTNNYCHIYSKKNFKNLMKKNKKIYRKSNKNGIGMIEFSHFKVFFIDKI